MATSRWVRVDRWMRWLHLYTGLFLTPWMLVYGTSALFLNHNAWFQEKLGIEPMKMAEVRRMDFVPDDGFPRDPEQQAERILALLDLQGPHRVLPKPPPNQMVIMRLSLSGNRRIVWLKRQSQLIVQKQGPFSYYRLIHMLHFRAGYGQSRAAFVAWAVIVDAVAVSLWLWVLSGIYLWARRKGKRALGLILLLGGIGTFTTLVLLMCS